MKIDYDKIADVLYIAIKDRPGIADEVSDGSFIRYHLAGEIVGITILDFKERFIDPPRDPYYESLMKGSDTIITGQK